MNDQSFWVHAAISHTAYLTRPERSSAVLPPPCSAATALRDSRSAQWRHAAATLSSPPPTGPAAENGRKIVDCTGVKSESWDLHISCTSFFQSSQKEKISNIGPAHIIETQNENTNHWKLATSRSRSCRKSISACSSSCPFTPHLHEKLENRCSSSKPMWCAKNRTLQPQSPALQLQNPQPPHLRAAPMASANWEASPRFKALRRAETCGKSQGGLGQALKIWRD